MVMCGPECAGARFEIGKTLDQVAISKVKADAYLLSRLLFNLGIGYLRCAGMLREGLSARFSWQCRGSCDRLRLMTADFFYAISG